MSEVTLRINENAKINILIKRLNSVYKREIAIPLKRIRREDLTTFLGERLPQAVEQLHKVTDNQITQLLKLEIFRGKGTKLSPERLNGLLSQFKTKSRYNEAFNNFAERVKEKLISASLDDFAMVADFSKLANEIGVAEFHSMSRIVTTESIAAINWGREQNYKIRDPLNEYDYRWSIRKDRRTSEQCYEIDDRVQEAGGSMKLEPLKQLINEIAVKYDPKWQTRDWVPHYNCRSLLIRTISLENL